MSDIIHILKNRITCAGLYLWLWICRRTLRLHAISKPDLFIFSENSLRLYWNVGGCYKIIVNDRIALPGSVRSVKLNPKQITGVLKICFVGCNSQLTKRFSIHKVKLVFNKPEPKLSGIISTNISLHRVGHLSPVKRDNKLHVKTSFVIKNFLQSQFLSISMVQTPVLNIQLDPYPLYLTQPEYETTVL